uniref:Uncharacterized protein n=1 Tax=Rhizophora mucronata TaxID=61149 RepID=A0A2P2PEQ5_RHIMU
MNDAKISTKSNGEAR